MRSVFILLLAPAAHASTCYNDAGQPVDCSEAQLSAWMVQCNGDDGYGNSAGPKSRHRRGDDEAQRAAIVSAWWSFQYDAAPLSLPRRSSAARCDAACVALRAARRNAGNAGCAKREG